jgi:flagella basal body P-ring formation protein FlgA
MKKSVESPFLFIAASMLALMKFLLVTLVGVATLEANAQAPAVAEGADAVAIYARAQSWLDQNLNETATGLPLRLEVVVGELDRRLHLAPCEQVEPFIPAGTRLWGKTRLGLRCIRGPSRWNVFLPITVKAFGMAWVVKGGVAPGAVLREADAWEVEVDWAEQSSQIIANKSDWLGQTATRQLSTGQPLRQDMLRATQVFQAGAQVQVQAQGSGFQIATSAQALSAGVVGQTARVRMDNGHIMSGLVLDNRTVRLSL